MMSKVASGEWVSGDVFDFLELKRGYDLPVSQRENGAYPIIASNGLLDYHSEYMVEGPGVVTGRSGTLGKVYFVNGNFWPLNTALYIKDFKGNDALLCVLLFENFRAGKVWHWDWCSHIKPKRCSQSKSRISITARTKKNRPNPVVRR